MKIKKVKRQSATDSCMTVTNVTTQLPLRKMARLRKFKWCDSSAHIEQCNNLNMA